MGDIQNELSNDSSYVNYVTANNGRHFSTKDDLTIARQDKDTWIACQSLLSTRHILTADREYIVQFDFSKFAEFRYDSCRRMELVHIDQIPLSEAYNDLSFDDVKWRSEIESVKKETLAQYISDSALFDIFLILNISNPGSMDLYSTKSLLRNASDENELRLSAYLFEINRLDNDTKWPEIPQIPLEVVKEWFDSARPLHGHISSSPVERAIFSMLHLCKSDTSSASIIWIFHALEALYGARVGENLRIVTERIARYFEADTRQIKKIGKTLRNLYDLRSGFVHGGMDTIHPLQNELVDKRVEDLRSRIDDATMSGFRFILFTLQKMIIEGRTHLRFIEMID